MLSSDASVGVDCVVLLFASGHQPNTKEREDVTGTMRRKLSVEEASLDLGLLKQHEKRWFRADIILPLNMLS